MMMVEALKSVDGLAGDYAECGVYKGDSAYFILTLMAKDAELLLFDTFEGHPEISEFDNPLYHPKGRYGDNDVKEVAQRFAGDERVEIIPGEFKDTLPEYRHRRFRFVNIDCDLYQSYRDCLKFFMPRMVAGGIIRVDDYHDESCPGAKKAVDEIAGNRLVDGEYIYF